MILVGGRGADDLVVRGARVLDPTERVDAVLDVRVDGGAITALGPDLDRNGHRVLDGAGLVLAPADEDHATPKTVSTATGPLVSRS